MLKTASILLEVTGEQSELLRALEVAYADACNSIVPTVRERRVWNLVELHKLVYRQLRNTTLLGSQMCCNVISSVCQVFKALKTRKRIKPNKPVPEVVFKPKSIHFDKRTYSLKDNVLSLYTLAGRIKVTIRPGPQQLAILASGEHKEAELIFHRGRWFFNLVVESATPESSQSTLAMGIDVGENNIAAHSLGKIYGGEQLRDNRDRYLAYRRRLQSNGSQSAKQKLRQVSGKESRHVRHINHEISKSIVREAVEANIGVIVMEDLTDIRERIKCGKRMRARLHRWAWRQLQSFVDYKAKAHGIAVQYCNPAYTSQTCSSCGHLGKRVKHRFTCECGLRAHSDLNASRNLARIAGTAVSVRALVNAPNVGSLALR